MKYPILAAALFVSVTVAQDPKLLADLPKCGVCDPPPPTGSPWCSNSDIDQQNCITDLLGQAKQLGCGTADVICLCQNEDFRNGIHDCTYESCPADADKQKVIDAGTEYCRRKFDRYCWPCRREYLRLRRSFGCCLFRCLFGRLGRHWQQ